MQAGSREGFLGLSGFRTWTVSRACLKAVDCGTEHQGFLSETEPPPLHRDLETSVCTGPASSQTRGHSDQPLIREEGLGKRAAAGDPKIDRWAT